MLTLHGRWTIINVNSDYTFTQSIESATYAHLLLGQCEQSHTY